MVLVVLNESWVLRLEGSGGGDGGGGGGGDSGGDAGGGGVVTH